MSKKTSVRVDIPASTIDQLTVIRGRRMQVNPTNYPKSNTAAIVALIEEEFMRLPQEVSFSATSSLDGELKNL